MHVYIDIPSSILSGIPTPWVLLQNCHSDLKVQKCITKLSSQTFLDRGAWRSLHVAILKKKNGSHCQQ